jgi:DNA-binding protein Alba
MMTSAIVQTARQQTVEGAARQEIPPSVLVIGKKHAGEYLAPALFRLSSEGRLEIKARGSLSIVTAVDVAELVRRNVPSLSIQSITVGTDEVVIDGINRRMSTIEIAISKEELQLPVSTPQLPAHIEVHEEYPAAPSVVEQDPASIVDRILAEPASKPKRAPRATKATKKVQRKKTKAKTKSSD